MSQIGFFDPQANYCLRCSEITEAIIVQAKSAKRLQQDINKALDLDKWVSKAINSGIAALKNFASFLLKDLDAVRNALIFERSNGKVEAQVNRLKTLNRQMYGRANLDLLNARLLSITL
jgi:transposase